MRAPTATLLQGNCLDVLKTLPDQSVHCMVTSTPYYGLRDYGTGKWEGGEAGCDHNPQKPDGGERSGRTLPLGRGGMFLEVCQKCGAVRVDQQIGLEKSPEEFVARLVEIFREVRRVLRDDGTVWLNLGDSYVSNPGDRTKVGGFQANPSKERAQAESAMSFNKHGKGSKPKDLIGIPWMVAFALRADGWYLRSDIIWHKPNPMPESVKDRPTRSHEYIFLLTKSARYFYDAEAIAEPSVYPGDDRKARSASDQKRMPTEKVAGVRPGSATYPTRNSRSVWTITTKPYPEAHFATFPEDLPERCIKAGTSAKGVCPCCGNPWKRMVERIPIPRNEKREHSTEDQRQGKTPAPEPVPGANTSPIVTTIGWKPTCSCGQELVPAVVLDIFSGSGTTGAVALRLGRSYIGIELNEKYIELSRKRIGKVTLPLFVEGSEA